MLRRIRPGLAEDRVRHGDIVIDRVAHRVQPRRQGGAPRPHRVPPARLSSCSTPAGCSRREQLLDAVWGSDVYVETRTVDVHIGRLRKRPEPPTATDDPIRTVRSAGYALDV